MKTRNILTTTFLLGLLATPGARADSIWNVANGDWNTAGNWIPSGNLSTGGVPTADDIALIGTTATNQTANITSANAVFHFAVIGWESGSISTVNVQNSRTLTVDRIIVGDLGTGTLNIQSSGIVNSGFATWGFSGGGTGIATVTGVGSQWNNSGDLTIGLTGNNGTLNVQDGGTVTSGGVSLFANSTVTVTGAGSQLSTGGIGFVGNGTVNVQNGGTLNGYGDIRSEGTVNVTGTGSQWNAGSLALGDDYGISKLNIQNGGTVNSTGGAFIGIFHTGYYDQHNAPYPANLGTATVTGAGSHWNLGSNRVYIQAGTLTVDTGGKVTAGPVVLAGFVATEGTLNLNGTNGSRGVLEVGSIAKGEGSTGGHVNFNGGILRATGTEPNFIQGLQTGDVQIQSGGAFVDTNGFNVGISTAMQGNGGLTKQGGGKLTLSGASTFTGATTVEAGTLSINGSLTSDVTVQGGAILAGTGSAKAITLQSGATIAPGNSIGTLNTLGELWNGGGTYAWEVGAATGTAGTDWDFINVLGGLNIAATSGNKFTIDINGHLAGVLPGSVLDWTILSASSGFGGTFSADEFAFDTADFSSNTGGSFSLKTSGNDLVLEYVASPSPVPEPGSAGVLFAFSLGAVALLRRTPRFRRN